MENTKYGVYPVTIEVDGEQVTICHDTARRSIDGTKWICNDPQYAPTGIEPLQTLTLEEARVLMATPEWCGEED